jgi:hypothetical protein
MYSREDKTGWKQSNAFKKAFSINVEIEFVGVWYVPFFNMTQSLAPTVLRGAGIQFALWG